MSFAQTIFNWLPKFRKPDATLAEAQADASGNLKVVVQSVTAPATTWVRPQAGTPLTYERAVATTAKKLHTFEAANEGASGRWVMVFDRASTYAVNGAEPVEAWFVPAGSFVIMDWTGRPLSFSTGITWHVSSTAGTLTRDTTASFRVNAEVE